MKIIEGYTQADLPRLQYLNDECFTGPQCPPPQTFREMLSVSDVYRAIEYDVDPTMVLGFAIVRPWATIPPAGPYLWSLAVAPIHQHRGIGGKLLHYIIQMYKKETMSLHVHVDNPAQKLYYDYGFRVEGIAPGYYGDKDALVMRRAL